MNHERPYELPPIRYRSHLFSMKRLMLALVCSLIGSWAASQTYPLRPINWVVPFPPGGSTDLVVRALTEQLSSAWGQAMVIENKSGAGGGIGAQYVAKAPPDGYTLLFTTSSTHSIAPSLNKNLPYNADTDFLPIVHVANASHVLLVSKSVPAKNLKELIDHLKKYPGQLNYASSGSGTIIHLAAEAFKADAGLDVVHIPYKGSTQSISDVISGKVHLIFDNIVSGMPHARDGSLTAIAVTSKKRSTLAPEVPTFMEVGKDYGLGNFQTQTWYGIYAPKGTPTEVIGALNAEVNKALNTPKMKDKLNFLGAEAVGGTPLQFANFVKLDKARWADIIQKNHIIQD